MRENKEDLLSVLTDLNRVLGEDVLVFELNELGWTMIKSHPLEFFRGYLWEIPWNEKLERLPPIYNDFAAIAELYGYGIDGYNLIDIVPR